MVFQLCPHTLCVLLLAKRAFQQPTEILIAQHTLLGNLLENREINVLLAVGHLSHNGRLAAFQLKAKISVIALSPQENEPLFRQPLLNVWARIRLLSHLWGDTA